MIKVYAKIILAYHKKVQWQKSGKERRFRIFKYMIYTVLNQKSIVDTYIRTRAKTVLL